MLRRFVSGNFVSEDVEEKEDEEERLLRALEDEARPGVVEPSAADDLRDDDDCRGAGRVTCGSVCGASSMEKALIC